MSKSPQGKGKVFEEQFRDFLKDLHKRHRANFYRFYDTHSAGSYLPNQPADFLLGFQGAMHFFELKSSEKHQTLASGLSDLMDKDQAAHLRLWARAGACVHVLFLSQADGFIELWDGLVVSLARADGKRIKRDGVCLGYMTFPDFAEDFERCLHSNPYFMAGA